MAKNKKVEIPEKSEEKVERKEPRVGETIRVYFKVLEKEGKTRETFFEGDLIAKKGQGNGKTITVRRIGSNKIAIERIFPLYSPLITKIETKSKPKKRARRAKLYYQRQAYNK